MSVSNRDSSAKPSRWAVRTRLMFAASTSPAGPTRVEGAPRVLVRSGGELIRRTALALMLTVVRTGCEKPVYYSDCDAVRVAGIAPLHQGQPGYSRDLDRDGNGVACQD